MIDPTFNTLQFALVGILIVFTALAIIVAVISLVRRADEGWRARETKAERDTFGLEATVDTTTLILITAAAATMIQGRFHITRIRRLMPGDAATGGWSASGRAILHGSHVLPKRRY